MRLSRAIPILVLVSAAALLSSVPFGAFTSSRSTIAIAAPGIENAAPDSAVIVIPMDGRPPQTVPRIHAGDDSFVPLGSLACALAVPFAWDPYTYRGWIATDSSRVDFVLDSPVLSRKGEPIQLPAPIRYNPRGVLIPLDFLAVLAEQWHGRRSVSWSAETATFTWGAETPAFHIVRVTHVGRQSMLKIPMREAPKATNLLWSPVGRLDVYLDGASANSESLTVAGLPHGGALSVRGITGAPNGSRIRLEVTPEALGASTRYDAREGEWELSTTGSRDEIGRGGFRGLQQADRSRWDVERAAGPVVIAPCFSRATDPAEADSALGDLARRIATTLADTLLIRAEVVYPADPLSGAQSANAGHARCVVGLRLDRYATGTGKVQIWSAVPRLRWEPVDLTQQLQEVPPRPLLWSEAPALSEPESRRIASTLAAHLGTLIGGDRVEVGGRPSRWLEGLTMPAVMVYPAQTNDALSLERLMDDEQRADLARAIAFGLSEAISPTGEGSVGILGTIRSGASPETPESPEAPEGPRGRGGREGRRP